MLRKLSLSSLVLLIQKDELLRVLCAALLSLLFLIAQLVLQPFKRSADNWTCAVFQLCITLIFQCVLVLKVCNQSSELCESFGFDERGDGLFLFYVIFAVLVMLGMLLGGIYHLARETARATGVLCLCLTRAEPELSLSQGTTYHLFLSHVWSSAQDQVAVIKRCGCWPCLICLRRTRPHTS